ncbi:MAG: ribonuclease PH [Acidobacteria bacterium]|nr:ribonuclease PH [Acidobacteriota bacterium]MCG2814979.1 ribonuclease PH [Candidatus Aminicenantes bacterium]
MRNSQRKNNELRPIKILPHYLEVADGSAFIEMGNNKIIVAATIEDKIPHFMKGSGKGWITAEYAMLPRSTDRRNIRERNQGRTSGRSQEIQRLIGRALRTVVDMNLLGERTIIIDCDVIQADGGTRTASINGACIALALALQQMMNKGIIDTMPLTNLIAAVSVGIVDGRPLLDLDYSEDSQAETDMNVVMTDTGRFIEIQASAEKSPLSKEKFNELLALSEEGLEKIIEYEKSVLKNESLLFMAYGNNRGSE